MCGTGMLLTEAPKGAFVVGCDVDATMESYPKLLREFRRVLKPAGRCFLLTSAENEATLAKAAEPWTTIARATWKLGNKLPAIVLALTPSDVGASYSLDIFSSKAGRCLLPFQCVFEVTTAVSTFQVGSDISNAVARSARDGTAPKQARLALLFSITGVLVRHQWAI
eukprot:s998_g2.t1